MKKAFKMKLKPNQHEEYRRRHDELWPEMQEMLKAHGALSYSIFLEPSTDSLFAYLEVQDSDLWEKTAKTEINQKWWQYMADIMETNADFSPVSSELIQVFEL